MNIPRTVTRTRRASVGIAVVGSLLVSSLVAHVAFANSTKLTVEAVDAYGSACGPLGGDIDNVDGFRQKMTSIPGFTNGLRYTDSSVWATDFLDAQKYTGGQDQSNFDRTGDAISYFSGHGNCDDQTNNTCTSAATCADMAGYAKICLRDNKAGTAGHCSYSIGRKLTVLPCNDINFSNGNVVWGESPDSGGWDLAGLNGGINMAVLDISCGVTPNQWTAQMQPAFGGMRLIGNLMPTKHGDDTVDFAERGGAFGYIYTIGADMDSPSRAWNNTIDIITIGSSCALGGGGQGFSGCGAHITYSVDSTNARVSDEISTQTWTDFRDDTQDSIGNGWHAWMYTCNYDCATYPWRLP